MNKPIFKTPQEALRYNVTGAIERGEKQPIIEILAPDYEQEAAIADAQQMADDDMWEDMAKKLEDHRHNPGIDTDAIEGVKP